MRTSSSGSDAAADVVERAARRGHDDVRRRGRAPAAGGRSAGRRRSATTLTPSSRPYLKIASLTCTASSRVGTRTSADGRHDLGGRVDPLQHRQRERRGLAGAGGRLAEQVAAGEQERDRLALDRRRLLVAEVGERLQQLGPKAEVGEPVATFTIDFTIAIHRHIIVGHHEPALPLPRSTDANHRRLRNRT